MSERAHPSPLDEERAATWDADALAATLDASIAPTQDLALGAGFRLTLTDASIHIEIVPAGRAAQIVADEARMMVIVADQDPPQLTTTGVVFERPVRALRVSAAGEIKLDAIPAALDDAVERHKTRAVTAERPDAHPPSETATSDDYMTPEMPSATLSPGPSPPSSPEAERV